MKVSVQKIYRVLFYLLLFVNLFFKSIELNVGFGLIILVFLLTIPPVKYSITLVNIIFPLLVILFISLISGMFYDATLFDKIKDGVYFFKPVLWLLIGYLLISKIEDKKFFFNALIYTALVSATIHVIGLILFTFNNPFSVERIRGELGRDNFIELFALAALSVYETKVFLSNWILKRIKLIRFLLIISFIFYFSRAMFIGFLLITLSIKGYTKVSAKGIMYFSVFSLLVVSIFTSLQYVELERESAGVEGFLYKLKQAPSEIFQPDLNIDIKNHRSLWDHWRAYEALKAIDGVDDTKYKLGWVFGKGLGAQVDLGFEAPLDGNKLQFIPIIHNGYIFVLFKAGILGLLIYLSVLIYAYSQSYNFAPTITLGFLNNFISGTAIFFILTSLIITGMYNKGDIVVFLLGGLFALQYVYSNIQKQE